MAGYLRLVMGYPPLKRPYHGSFEEELQVFL